MNEQEGKDVVDRLRRAAKAGAPVVELVGSEARGFVFVEDIDVRKTLLGSFAVNVPNELPFFVSVVAKVNRTDEFQFFVMERRQGSPVLGTSNVEGTCLRWRYSPTKQSGDNAARKQAFISKNGSDIIDIPLPGDDVMPFAEAIRRAIAQRHRADGDDIALAPEIEDAGHESKETILESLFPNRTDLVIAAKALARAILVAHRTNPKSWCVTQPNEERLVRLNVGMVRVLNLRAGRIELAVDGDKLGAVTSTGFEIDLGKDYAIPSLPENGVARFSPATTAVVPDVIQEAHEAFIVAAAARASSFAWAHRPEIVEQVAKLSGMVLPRPSYDGTATVTDGDFDVHALIAAWLPTAGDDQAIRDDAAAKARIIIQENLGRLTESLLRDVLRHINTCRSDSGKVAFSRFSPAFVGHNANKLVGALPQLNPLIERLWTAPPAELPAVIDDFLADAPPGAGLGLPTVLLSLRSPDHHVVWTDGIERNVRKLLDVPAHERSGAGYLAYCSDIQAFLTEHGIPPSLYDKAIWVLDQAWGKANTSTDSNDDSGAAGRAFTGFIPDTFAFMAELRDNNRDDWFEKNRDRFHESVSEPLRSLVEDIGARVIHGLAPNLETAAKSGKTISKIRKNTWGKKAEGGYQPWFWAAFYRRDRTRHTDAQLFVDIQGQGFNHGFFVSESAQDVMQRLATACTTRPRLVDTIIAALLADGFGFASSTTVAADPDDEVVESAADLARILGAAAAVKVSKATSPADACAEGPALADRVGDDLRQLYALFALATEEAPPDSIVDFLRDDAEVVAESVAAPAITFATLHERTFLDGPFFARIDRLLTQKRQVIFHGPPGTGKTHVAVQYAAYLAQHGGEVTVVQFHPSYGYEDFVEGLRPVVEGGQLHYRVVPGIFRTLCDKARRNPKARFVLIVDEINRGNLPRIFGELLFLLERRDQSVVLPYSKETFSVPDNVIVIGTMNSADRSIALLDLALRRRFHFVSMAPSEAILRSWLAANGRPLWVADLLATLNGQLEASGIEAERLVGHSHFMEKGIDDEGLELVWEATIQPLLAELFFAQGDPLVELTLDKLRNRLPGLGTSP